MESRQTTSIDARLDHVIVLVDDLDRAMMNYSSLGFTVRQGGRHKDGLTHNALIALADGSYIELLAPVDPASVLVADLAQAGGFLRWFAHGAGFAGYALQVEHLQETAPRLKAAGIEVSSPVEGGRRLPEGQTIRWRIANIGRQPMPFLIEDISPRRLRVSDEPAVTTHANGASGISELWIESSDPDGANTHHTALYGAPTKFADPDIISWAGQGFTVNLMVRHTSTPRKEDRLVRVSLSAADTQVLDQERTHGALLRLIRPEPRETERDR